MNGKGSRRSKAFQPWGEPVEGRLLLSARAGGPTPLQRIYHQPLGHAAARPNTPVLPFAARTAVATFIDPSVRITNGEHVIVGGKTYIAPFATLNATTGFIKIGSNSVIEDNATVISNPNHARPTTSVLIGDNTVIGFGAVVRGPSTIGAYGDARRNTASRPTGIGANALIDGAIIQQGAIVGALARVGPGVTVPTGFFVLQGANVTTNAEASNPALGKVRPVTPADTSEITSALGTGAQLAAGYTTLYQGNSATGNVPAPAAPATILGPSVQPTGVFNGNLAAVEGASSEPGSTAPGSVSFEPPPPAPTGAVASPFPAGAQAPKFLSSDGRLLQANLFNFPARVIGQAVFQARAHQVAHQLGRSNSIRADQGQPITFASAPTTGPGVTITSPLLGVTATTPPPPTPPIGSLPIGENLRVGGGAVILGGSTTPAPSSVIGNNVTIGSGAVINNSKLGDGSTIGDRAFISQSTIPNGVTIPPGAIFINNRLIGFVQW
jgi:carbonic anhydrase/acetyltransferase-like protein (isoleucine patch superfamily)